MPKPKQNARGKAGALLPKLAASESEQNKKTQPESNTDSTILSCKSAATEVQREKVLALLRQGPHTTLELRLHSILMPSSRIFELKHFHDCIITTELIALYDDQGVRHSKCARYHLVQQSPPQGALDFGSPT